ncbi:hypothetical protein ACRV4Y_005080 [Escherichia coli]|nr:hypothetical protein [Escherichia coli]
MSPASCFRQRAAFTFGTEQPIVTIKRICLQDTPEKRRCKSGGEGCISGYRLAELVLMHERLARQQVCG